MQKTFLYVSLAAVLTLPGISMGATVSSITETSVSTGGIHVSAGSQTSGSSNTSVSITNVVNAGDGGGEVDAQVRTEENGVVHTQSIHRDIVPGQRIDIRLGTTTQGAQSPVRSEIRVTANTGTSSVLVRDFGEASTTSDNWWSWLWAGPAASTSASTTDVIQAPAAMSIFFGPGGFFDRLFQHPFSFFGIW